MTPHYFRDFVHYFIPLLIKLDIPFYGHWFDKYEDMDDIDMHSKYRQLTCEYKATRGLM